MSISNINAVPYNTIQFINGVPILSITYINGSPVITPSSSLQYLLIGGSFSTYNAPSVTRIARINTSGDLVLNSSFNIGTGFNGTPHDIKKQPDGKIIIASAATLYSGSTISRVARLNPNGTLDTTLNTGTLNQLARCIIPQSDNSNIIVGDFTSISGSTRSRYIAKLMPSGGLDPAFDPGMGFSQQVYNAATQSDGKIIAVGEFFNYYQSNAYITRTTLSGSQNAGPSYDFNTGVGFNNVVLTFATQSDGKILVGGTFTQYSGSSTNTTRIIRLNTNGTQDTSFVTGVGFNTDVYDIKVQPDGKIVVGGLFTTYSGSTVNYITRLNTNGTRDLTFNTGTAASSTVFKNVIQSDGKIVLVGNFSTYNAVSSPGIIRIDNSGSRDATFNVGAGTVGGAYTLNPTGSQYIVAGNFTSYSGSARNYIVRINSDGTIDTSFNIGTGFSSTVNAIALDATGKILANGNFTTYSGSSTNTTRIIRLNTNGTQDTSFVTGVGVTTSTLNPGLLSVESDGKIYLGNGFSSYSGSIVNYFARINQNGTLDTTFDSYLITTSSQLGFNNAPRALFVKDSNIYFCGSFTAYKPTNYIVRINTDGTWDPTFAIGAGFGSGAYNLKVLPDDKIVVVGNFTTYSGSTTNDNRIIRLNADGTQDTSFNSGTSGFNSTSHDLDIQPDGKILVLGAFTTYSGSTNNYITRINSNGTRDTTFNVGSAFGTVSAGVNTMKILSLPDGKVMVTIPLVISYSGSTAGNILRLNSSGTLDTTFDSLSPNRFNRTGFGFAGSTGNPGGYTMFMTGSDVIVGGQFTTYKAPEFDNGGMIDSTGNISQSFNIGGAGFSSTVYTYTTQSDGKILAGGNFASYSSSTSARIVRINSNGTRDTTFNVGTGFNGTVYDVKIQSDGKILVVGTFSTYSGSSSSGLIRLNTDGTRDITYNVGTGLTTNTQGNQIAIQTDDKIVVVGSFTAYSGSSTNRIVRVNTNGTRDTTFNVGSGLNNSTEAVLLQSDGKIVTAGGFNAYSGSSVNGITRINSNGTRDTTFNVGAGITTLAGYALTQQSDGKIIFANGSQTYSGSTNRYLVRINTSGTLDTTFNANITAGISVAGFTANSLKIDNNGKIYWGNTFTTFSGSNVPNRIVRLNVSGSIDQTFNQDYNNYINGLGKGADGNVNAILLL